MITENYLKLSTKNRNITLPLYSSLYIEQVTSISVIQNSTKKSNSSFRYNVIA